MAYSNLPQTLRSCFLLQLKLEIATTAAGEQFDFKGSFMK